MTGEHPPVYPPATWRLLVHGPADGATNMAVDHAILDAVVEGASLPTLRFYDWSPPCLSLGRSQTLSEIDLAACQAAGVDIVRRPTGGRSILHCDELTYSVTLPQTDPRSEGGVVEGYRRLSEGLLAGLHRLGVPAVQAVGVHTPGQDPTAACFEVPSAYEIAVAGRKLVGSAQWRARGGVLQHGTLPLCGDLTRVVDYLSLTDADREAQRCRLHLQALTLEEALGRILPFDRVVEALVTGFAQALNLALVPAELAPAERAWSVELKDRIYAALDWTARL